jgi:hypothetical protein
MPDDLTPTRASRPYCWDCYAVGMWHCSDPIHCGGDKEPDNTPLKEEPSP